MTRNLEATTAAPDCSQPLSDDAKPERSSRAGALFIDIPAEIFRASPELVPDMPEHLNAQSLSHNSSAQRYRVLLYGCSLTTQYGDALAARLESFLPVEVWMCGLSGRTAAELARMADRPVIEDVTHRVGKGLKVVLEHDEAFDLVIIMAGTNDLGMGYHADNVIENVKKLHEICHKYGVKTVALSLPPNVACERSPDYKEKWTSVNQALSALQGDSVSLFFDTGEVVPLDEEGRYYNLDRLHFSLDGSERLGTSLAEKLARVLSPNLEEPSRNTP